MSAMSPMAPMAVTDGRPAGSRVDWRGVVVFVAAAYALMWLATVPFWLSPRGLGMPGAKLILIAVMFAPTLASLLVCRTVDRRPWTRAVGLRSASPVGRIVGYCLLALLLVPVALAVSTAIAAALGLQHLDLAHLSGVAALQRTQPAPVAQLPVGLFFGIQLLNIVIQIVSIGGVSALGEEIGWRGYLLGALLPLGRGRALLITGVIWALWHLPLILLGYEYPGAARGSAVLAFVVSTTTVGAVLGWLRLRSDSVIPGAIGHASLNGWSAVVLLLLAPGRPTHVLLGSPQGLVMIVCFLALVAALFGLDRSRHRRPRPRTTPRTATTAAR